jgi:uncharacterized small protein (DUF1192 family)
MPDGFMNSYYRCLHFDDSSAQCETWARSIDGAENKYCSAHDGSISHPEKKEVYIDLLNAERRLCFAMTLEELDTHIAGIEKEIERLKASLLSSRATRAEKIDKLSDDEREQRRKIKVVSPEPKEKKVTSIKKDPLKYMMEKHGLTEVQAKKMLGL